MRPQPTRTTLIRRLPIRLAKPGQDRPPTWIRRSARVGSSQLGQALLQRAHVLGRRRFEPEPLAGARMHEAQHGGVKRLARKAGLGHGLADGGCGGAGAIDGIAQAPVEARWRRIWGARPGSSRPATRPASGLADGPNSRSTA